MGDVPNSRRVAAMAAADRERIARWSSAVRGAAQMIRWQSAELRRRAAVTREKAQALRAARNGILNDRNAD